TKVVGMCGGGDGEWFCVRRWGRFAGKMGTRFWREALCLAQCFKDAGESVAASEICYRLRKHRCGAQKAAAAAAQHLVFPKFSLLLYIVFVDPSCDHILDTFSTHPPS
nr:hypothetical protein [Tanacetum cinerariifolium]